MITRSGNTQRHGRIYRFLVQETEYTAFIWQDGARFHGRIEKHPHIPQCTKKTAALVRDTLHQQLLSSLTQ
jgi:hypothetical protein